VTDYFFLHKFASAPFIRTSFNKLSHVYSTNFRQTYIYIVDSYKFQKELPTLFGIEFGPSTVSKENFADNVVVVDLKLFPAADETVRNVETIYRSALELVIILLLLRFHSVIGVTSQR